MGSVILGISMSLDGFVAGPNIRVGLPIGEEGERLRNWLGGGGAGAAAAVYHEVANEVSASTGASVMELHHPRPPEEVPTRSLD